MEMSINGFLTVPKKERMKLLKRLKAETKERIFNNTLTMTQLASLETVESYEERVRIRYEMIQKEPETLFWDYLELLGNGGELYRSDKILVSTNGDVVTLSPKGALYINLGCDWDKGNRYRGMCVGKKQCRIHRAVASTFIPIPEGLNIKNVEVNHKDLMKCNNPVNNLEWITKVSNNRHKLGYGNYVEYEHLLCTVIVDNGFKGRQFVINRNKCPAEFSIRYMLDAASGMHGGISKGFKIDYIKDDDITLHYLGFPDEIRELFNRDRNYFKPNVKPVIGTIVIGPYKGYKFSLFGEAETGSRFNHFKVMTASKKKGMVVDGCTFRRASHKEAIPLHKRLTDRIYKTLK